MLTKYRGLRSKKAIYLGSTAENTGEVANGIVKVSHDDSYKQKLGLGAHCGYAVKVGAGENHEVLSFFQSGVVRPDRYLLLLFMAAATYAKVRTVSSFLHKWRTISLSGDAATEAEQFRRA
jgi:hypothetical protein